MFERFTEDARQVVVLAQQESRGLGHEYIGCEHLLLGLTLEQAGGAANVLEANGLTHATIRAQVVRIVGEGQEVQTGQIPFLPNAKRALEDAMREAHKLGHAQIGTAHLLLGLLVHDNVAQQIIAGLSVDVDQLRGQAEAAAVAKPHPAVQEPNLSGIEHVQITLTPRARAIWMAAAASALEDGRTQIGPGDLLEPLLGEKRISSLLAGAGYDPAPILERLSHMGWTEPDTLDET